MLAEADKKLFMKIKEDNHPLQYIVLKPKETDYNLRRKTSFKPQY